MEWKFEPRPKLYRKVDELPKRRKCKMCGREFDVNHDEHCPWPMMCGACHNHIEHLKKKQAEDFIDKFKARRQNEKDHRQKWSSGLVKPRVYHGEFQKAEPKFMARNKKLIDNNSNVPHKARGFLPPSPLHDLNIHPINATRQPSTQLKTMTLSSTAPPNFGTSTAGSSSSYTSSSTSASSYSSKHNDTIPADCSYLLAKTTGQTYLNPTPSTRPSCTGFRSTPSYSTPDPASTRYPTAASSRYPHPSYSATSDHAPRRPSVKTSIYIEVRYQG